MVREDICNFHIVFLWPFKIFHGFVASIRHLQQYCWNLTFINENTSAVLLDYWIWKGIVSVSVANFYFVSQIISKWCLFPEPFEYSIKKQRF